jgi:hypothetical protein
MPAVDLVISGPRRRRLRRSLSLHTLRFLIAIVRLELWLHKTARILPFRST